VRVHILSDPLTQVVSLLRPSASFSKLVYGAGSWRVSRAEAGRPFYCAILDGFLRLTVQDHEPITLEKGDFILIPAAYDFVMSSVTPMKPTHIEPAPLVLRPGVVRIGDRDGSPDIRSIVGYCVFGSNDKSLLVSLLPQLVHTRGEERLTTLVQLIDEESRGSRPAREVILARLIEVLLIEALRSTSGPTAASGLLRGLANERIAIALKLIHEHPSRSWTVAALANEAALSRSAFFECFRRGMGMTPMEYLLQWRMALAKDMLSRKEGSVAEVAERVGYSSASTFSVAFARHIGLPPAAFARGNTIL
jgi:AraC-like DNA-binding protein